MARPLTYHMQDQVYDTVCGKCRVINFVDSAHVEVQFLKTKHTAWFPAGDIRSGKIKDPLHPSIHGVGFIGVGPYSSANVIEYRLWRNMLLRCYGGSATYASYAGCTVVKRWHNFQTFCEDVHNMSNWNVAGFALDKDMRVLGNRKYGPDYCSFVPNEINAQYLAKPTQYEGLTKEGRGYSVHLTRKHLASGLSLKEATSLYRREKRKKLRQLAKKHRDVVHKDVYNNLKGWGA